MTPLRTLLLATALVGIGFVVGYGFQARGAKPAAPTEASPTPQPPQVKGLHASPDGKLLAFTGVYARSEHAGLWILNPASGVANGRPSPAGWQDYVTQWRSDGRSLLVEREKIPRPVEDAKAGLYYAPVERDISSAGELEPVDSGDLPTGEKVVTGILTPKDELVIKTRREPKALFRIGSTTQLLDRANITYGQNRPVIENGQLVFYVVRDVPNDPRASALFRVINGKATQILPSLNDVVWSYVAPSGKQLIVARHDDDSDDWTWTLYRIGKTQVNQVKTATIPADVISVYWSPDEKRVLGAAGEKLWIVDVPSLKVTQLGTKADWNADDATWMNNSTVAVAQNGEIWRLDIPKGSGVRLWRFPDQFWN